VIALDLLGVAVSTGSACAAGASEPSHVIRALGVVDEVARGVIRLSFGREIGSREVCEAAARIGEVVRRARQTPGTRTPGTRRLDGRASEGNHAA
jgi:cysteine desulfurase